VPGPTGATGATGADGRTKIVASSLTYAKYLTGAGDGWKVNSVKWFGATNITSSVNNVTYLWIVSGGSSGNQNVPEWVFFNPPDVAIGHDPFTIQPQHTTPHFNGRVIPVVASSIAMHHATGYIAPYKGRIVGYSINSITPWAVGVNQARNLPSVPVFVGRAFHNGSTNGYYSLELTGKLQTPHTPGLTGPQPCGGYERFLPAGGAGYPSPQQFTSWEIAFDAGDYLVSGLTPTWAAYVSGGATALPNGYTSNTGIYLNPPVSVTIHVIYEI
jgi:hypothetical protein